MFERARIVRTQYPADLSTHLNLYAGTGRCGASFDPTGLMHHSGLPTMESPYGRTALLHADHYHLGKHGVDNHVGLANLRFQKQPPAPHIYKQEQSFPSGTIRTEYACDQAAYTIETLFSPEAPDAMVLRLTWSGDLASVVETLDLNLEKERTTYPYQDPYSGTSTTVLRDGGAELSLTIQDTPTHLHVSWSADHSVTVQTTECGLRITPVGPSGELTLRIVAGSPKRSDELARQLTELSSATFTQLKEATESAWRKRWGHAALRMEAKDLEGLWVRGMHSILASYAPDIRCPAPPNGWTGNCWGYGFPQDWSYIHPALLRLGHADIVRAWVEYFHSDKEAVESTTERVYGHKGTMWPWEYPIHGSADLLEGCEEGALSYYQYEIHNASYPARMAYDTARVMGLVGRARGAASSTSDNWWLTEGWPVVRGSAEFYLSALKKNQSGTWGMHVRPSMGTRRVGRPQSQQLPLLLFRSSVRP